MAWTNIQTIEKEASATSITLGAVDKLGKYAFKASTGCTYLLDSDQTASGSTKFSQNINFTSNGQNFVTFLRGDVWIRYYTDKTNYVQVYYNDKWTNQAYRTITFESEPTGSVKTFLSRYATKI